MRVQPLKFQPILSLGHFNTLSLISSTSETVQLQAQAEPPVPMPTPAPAPTPVGPVMGTQSDTPSSEPAGGTESTAPMESTDTGDRGGGEASGESWQQASSQLGKLERITDKFPHS